MAQRAKSVRVFNVQLTAPQRSSIISRGCQPSLTTCGLPLRGSPSLTQDLGNQALMLDLEIDHLLKELTDCRSEIRYESEGAVNFGNGQTGQGRS